MLRGCVCARSPQVVVARAIRGWAVAKAEAEGRRLPAYRDDDYDDDDGADDCDDAPRGAYGGDDDDPEVRLQWRPCAGARSHQEELVAPRRSAPY